MFDKYKKFMQNYISLNPLSWQVLKARLKVKRYKKGEIIHNIGDNSVELIFINSGLARAYIIDEKGKDYTWSIFFNDISSTMTNLYMVDYDSFINQVPSRFCIEALEDIEALALSYKDLNYIYEHSKEAQLMGRLMAEEAYSHIHNLFIDRQIKSAKERFEDFMEENYHLIDKVPQYHIASYLGITPQHLSRLKKEDMNICE